MKFLQSPEDTFPSPHTADEEGLLAIGGDVTPQRVLDAHCQGIFPWYNDDEMPLWWSPPMRGVLPCAQIHISRSLRKKMRQLSYTFTIDHDFNAVIHACQHTHGETWITDTIRQTYQTLHEQGHAHSFELWHNKQLVGGLYGVALNRVFCGESMFSLIPDASKIVLVLMCQYLNDKGFSHIDCQFVTPHLASMGAVNISRQQYLTLLDGDCTRTQGSWAEDL